MFTLNNFVSIFTFLSSFNAWMFIICVHRFAFVPFVDLCMDNFNTCNFCLQVLFSFVLRRTLSVDSFYTCNSCLQVCFLSSLSGLKTWIAFYACNSCLQVCFHSSLRGLKTWIAFYTCNSCLQVCFHSSLRGLKTWIAFTLATLVCKFAFIRPWVDLQHGSLLHLQLLFASLLSFVLTWT